MGPSAKAGPDDELLKILPNPFDENRVDSAWASGLSDVPGINHRAFEAVLRSIARVKESRSSRGLLIYGERGSGKTHLLHRIRNHTVTSPDGLFAYVRPSSAPDRMMRHLLSQLAADLQQREPAGLTQLEASAAGLLYEKKHGRRAKQKSDIAEFWAGLTGEIPHGPELFQYLEREFEEPAFELQLDANVVRAIEHLLARYHRTPAFQWLQARSVSEDGLSLLRIPENIETEDGAFDVIRALLSLSPESSVDLLAFDQIEGLLPRREARAQLEVFGGMIAKLISSIPGLLVISCTQLSFVPDLRTFVRQADYDRLALDKTSLEVMREKEDVAALLWERMRRLDDLQQARLFLKYANPLWPLQEEAVESMVRVGGRPIRDIIDAARVEFEVACRGPETMLGIPPPGETPRTMQEIWDRQLEEEMAAPAPPSDRGVLSDAVIKVVFAAPLASRRQVRQIENGDLDVEIGSGKDSTRVGFCNELNATSLAARLKRLHRAYPDTAKGVLVLARDERLPLRKTAKVVRDELIAIQKAGHTFSWVDASARAALLAAKKLLDAAAAGELSDGLKAIEPEDLQKWLASKLPEPLASAVSVLAQERQEAGNPPDFEALLSLLTDRFVMDLDTVALETGRPVKEWERLLSDPSAPAAVIAGSPGVVFLRPGSVPEA